MSSRLIALICISFFALNHFSIASSLPLDAQHEDNRLQTETGSVCKTQECVELADELIGRMNPEVDPCDDFYQYACGNFIKSNEIPEDKRVISTISSLNEDLFKKIRNLVEQEVDQENVSPTLRRLRNLYTSCMDLDTIEILGNQPINQLIHELGGWPVLSASNNQTIDQSTDRMNWVFVLGKFRRLGLYADKLFSLDLGTDYKNNSLLAISIDNPKLGLGRDIMIRGRDDPLVMAYYNSMVESAMYLGASKEDAVEQMTSVLDFELELAKHSMSREQQRNMANMYNMMTLKELSSKTPNIDWYRCFRLQMNVLFQPEDPVMVRVPEYITQLNRLLGETDEKTLQNFLIWRALLDTMPYLNKHWQSTLHKFDVTSGGNKVQRPRWQQCVELLKSSQSIAVASMFVERHFKRESKQHVEEIYGYIKREFHDTLEQVDWIHDDETRAEALAKLNRMRSFIGYPEELLDSARVESIYSNLGVIYEDRYFVNQLRLRKWHIDERFKLLTTPMPQDNGWRYHSEVATVNGYYDMVANHIELPAGILSGVFFGPTRPSYLNFAGVGTLVGHEITHGFDDRGRQFDREGNTRNWWDEVTDSRFRERAQCMIDQYNSYAVQEIGGIHLDGFHTQGENIADNGGLKVAFRAYERWTRENGDDLLLPRLAHLNQKKLFWLGAANVFCAKYRPELAKMLVLTDSHSPNEFRVNGPLSNLAEFSQTFECPTGSPMNPEKKCLIW